MNLSPTWVQFLEQNGFPAAHWSTVGSIRATDAEIMAHAAENHLVVFTHDLDFGALLASSKMSSPSVIQIRAQDLLPDAIGSPVIKTLLQVRQHQKPVRW
jgi:predicted nuclease of predicted toxin-antitoxin system